MKRTRNVLFIAAQAVLLIFLSCQDPVLTEPRIPGGGGGTERGILSPDGLRASQGERRSITLSWNVISNAARYNIYSSESPLNAFVQCGETNETQFKFNVPPGSTLYYRVSSVSLDGVESAKSAYVRGTSLAQPVITDITDITESSASVTWYMENVFEDSYKDDLLYTVYCFNGAYEVAQISLDGSVIQENRAVFTNLLPNTRYEYQVEAYLRRDQNISEKSDKMDSATARRFRPSAPVDPRASRGTAVGSITLSFELPDMVDIALGENLYDPKPLYFVIYKRFYSASGNNEYQKVCSYFGSIPGTGRVTFPSYVPGARVTWSDTGTGVSRGVKYEYMVQSYVDDTQKIITSDSSKASAVGWAMSEGSLSFGKVEYTMGTGLYAEASLPLDFEFDPQDVSYSYVLKEIIEPLGDGDALDPSGEITREIPFNTYNAVRAHVPKMDLTKKTTNDNPGRGLYSYKIEIKLNGDLLDTVSALGKKEVSENTDPIIVDNFRVQDGYTNKFVLKWEKYSNRKYELYTVNADGNNPVIIGSDNDNPSSDAVMTDGSFEYTAGVTTGVTRYFAIRPFRKLEDGTFKQGQMVYAPAASHTLGVPEVSLGGDHSYSAVTALWTDTQKADTYRVKWRYTGEDVYKTAATVKKEALSIDANGKLKYQFKPEGNEIDIAKAGKEIQIQIDALNEGLRATIGSGEISTSSKEDVRTRLVGPALLSLSAERGNSAQEITVSWNKINGADGYYVFRRKFNMNNTAEEGTEAVVYYVPAVETATITVTGKNMALDSSNAKIDTTMVKASASFADSRYALKDIFMPDNDYNGSVYNRHIPAYRDQQNDMAQGYPYRYWVVPAINATAVNSIDFVYNKDSYNKNTDILSYAIQENGANIKFSGAGAIEKNAGMGFIIGFGQNVTATKGTYSSSGNINNGIQVTWEPPPLLAQVPGFSPRYTVYRRYQIGEGWSAWTEAGNNISVLQHIENMTPGTIYEYVVGITNGSQASDPRSVRRFIDECYKQRDGKNRIKMQGFMQGMVKLVGVSRDARSDGQGSYGEEVTWTRDGFSVDGYSVYLLNRNINNNRQWIDLDTSVSGTTNSVLITNANNRLKVLREHRHFYKVRSYMLNDANVKIYGPDPEPNYTWAGGSGETDYVKWGARQVSADEFAAITALSIGTAMNWAGNQTSDVPDRRGDHNVDISESNVGYNRKINFSNSKPYFVTINGDLHGYCTATQNTPTQYGADCAGIWGAASGAKDHLSTLNIIGPGDVNGMYSGTVKILRMGSGAGNGPYKVSYNGQTDLGIDAKHYRECFTFEAASKNYKRTRNFDWSPSTGIAGTGTIGPNMADKWWYPLTNATRAGWD